VRLWENVYKLWLPQKADVGIVSPERSGHYLVDALWATIPAEYLTKEEGTIITISSCEKGWPPESGYYLDTIFDRNYPPKSLMRLSFEEICQLLMEHKFPCSRQVYSVVEFKSIVERRDIILVSRELIKMRSLSLVLRPVEP
jgi:hypothetical protein